MNLISWLRDRVSSFFYAQLELTSMWIVQYFAWFRQSLVLTRFLGIDCDHFYAIEYTFFLLMEVNIKQLWNSTPLGNVLVPNEHEQIFLSYIFVHTSFWTWHLGSNDVFTINRSVALICMHWHTIRLNPIRIGQLPISNIIINLNWNETVWDIMK